MARKRYKVKLNEEQKQQLTDLTKAGKCRIRVYKRARVLLLLNEGLSDNEIITQANVSLSTIKRMRQRFDQEGIQAIQDKPKAGRPSIFNGKQRAKITALACSSPPNGRARWTLRLLAEKAVELDYVKEISHESVALILKKTNSTLT